MLHLRGYPEEQETGDTSEGIAYRLFLLVVPATLNYEGAVARAPGPGLDVAGVAMRQGAENELAGHEGQFRGVGLLADGDRGIDEIHLRTGGRTEGLFDAGLNLLKGRYLAKALEIVAPFVHPFPRSNEVSFITSWLHYFIQPSMSSVITS